MVLDGHPAKSTVSVSSSCLPGAAIRDPHVGFLRLAGREGCVPLREIAIRLDQRLLRQ